jgi:hypothetical protein
MHRKFVLAFVAAGIGATAFVYAQQPAANPVPEIAGLPPAARSKTAFAA